MPSKNRRAIVEVGASGSGLKIDGLRMQFTVTRSIQAFPESLKLVIYNLNRSTQTKFEDEFTDIFLFAGFDGEGQEGHKLIFQGNIKNVSISSDGVDVKTTVFAGDSDVQFITATYSETVNTSVTLETLVRRIAATFANIKVGVLEGLSGKFEALRSQTFSGDSVVHLNELGDTYFFDWSISKGIFTTVPKTKKLSNIFVLGPQNMIGIPTVTEVGVDVKSELNPSFVPRGQVKIETDDSQIQAQDSSITRLPRTKANGTFPIVQVVHTGDTHKRQWESSIQTLFTLDGFIPKTNN